MRFLVLCFTFLVMFIPQVCSAGTIITHNGLMYSHLSYLPHCISVLESTQKHLRSIRLDYAITTFTIKNGYLYGLGSVDDVILVLNLATELVVNTVSVGQNPTHILFVNGFAYVTNEGSLDVSVIDLKDFVLVATIPLGTTPVHIAANDSHVFITGYTMTDVIVVDRLTHRTTGRIPLPAGLGSDHIYALLLQKTCSWICTKDETTHGLRLHKVNLELLSLDESLTLVPAGSLRLSQFQLTDVIKEGNSCFGLGGSRQLPIVLLLHHDLAYVFYGQGMSVLMIHELKKGRCLLSVGLPMDTGSIRFSETHLMYDDKPFVPLVPNRLTFKKMMETKSLYLYKDFCPDAFRITVPTLCDPEDLPFFREFSTVAALPQELIYDYLPPEIVLFALLHTSDNGYLKSLDWHYRKIDILRVITKLCWLRNKKRVQTIGTLLYYLDPTALDVFEHS